MKKQLTKLAALLLACTMLSLPLAAHAEAMPDPVEAADQTAPEPVTVAFRTIEQDGLIFTVYDNENAAYLTGIQDDLTVAVIPAEVEGIPVVGTSFSFSPYQYIHQGESLQEFRLAEGQTGWKVIDGALYSPDGKTLLAWPRGRAGACEIAEGTETIEQYACCACEGMTSLTLPSTLTRINYGAFTRCTGLTEVVIPDKVNNIAQGAFSGCTGLTTLHLGAAVAWIATDAFLNCRALSEVTSDSASYLVEDGGLYHVAQNKKNLTLWPSGRPETTLTIAPGTVTIDDNAVTGSDVITDVVIPEGVTRIGLGNFSDMSALTSLTVPEGVSYFAGLRRCDALEEIHLPSTLSFLDYSSLRDLPALKEIWINCTYADAQKIANWTSIETLRDPKILIHYADDAPFTLTEADGCAFKIFEDHAELIYAIDAPADLTIPETVDGQRVTAIADNALRGTDLTSVTIPEGVETIGKFAFYGCKTLTSVTLPQSLTSLGASVFANCDALTAVTVPAGITKIPTGFCMGCDALTDVALPDGITSIGDNAFYQCAALPSITVPDSVRYLGGNAFSECAALTFFRFPQEKCEVGACLFLRSGLQSVTIPSWMETIPRCMFAGTALTEVTLPATVHTIEELAFAECSKLKAVTILDPDCMVSSDYGPNYRGTISNVAEELSGGGCEIEVEYHYMGAIRGYAGTFAEEYAKASPCEFVPIEEIAGDLDADEDITIMDAIIINKALLGGMSLSGKQTALADLDGSGTPDTTDALMLLKKVVHLD